MRSIFRVVRTAVFLVAATTYLVYAVLYAMASAALADPPERVDLWFIAAAMLGTAMFLADTVMSDALKANHRAHRDGR